MHWDRVRERTYKLEMLGSLGILGVFVRVTDHSKTFVRDIDLCIARITLNTKLLIVAFLRRSSRHLVR